jgi:chromate reductase, NAD(P)H dehydrogenase (quinone)
MSYKPKILAFAGSLRQGSYNKKLIKHAIHGAEAAGAEVTYIDLHDFPLPLYNADIEEKEGLPENALKIKELMWKNDGFIIASPEYNSSIPGNLKNMIDWASRNASPSEVYLSCFIDKIALLLSASPGNLGGLRGLVHLRSILENIQTFVLPRQKTIANASEAFDPQGNLKNAEQKEAVEKLGKELAEVIIKLKQ